MAVEALALDATKPLILVDTGAALFSELAVARCCDLVLRFLMLVPGGVSSV